ncbi:GNAT family N-acetyltransferase, partial [Escherichia coli]|nr:GNAT family N-acetyltransferase [Escherichia coli]
AYYALYEAVYAQSELHFDHLTRDFFATVLRDAVAGGIVLEYRLDGELVGWNLCFEHDGRLVDKYIGLRYPQARDCNL